MVVFLLPFSYAFIVLLSGTSNGEALTYLLSGYIVSTLISTFINMLGMRITNIRQQEVLELYSTYTITFPQIVISECLTYFLFTLPIILIVFSYILIHSESANFFLFIIGVIIAILFLLLISVYLGLVMKNLFIANGLFQLLSWVLIIFSPIYYSFQNLNIVYKIILILNPTTHLLNIIRIPLGFSPIVSIGYSYVYILLLIALAIIYISRHIQNAYILEKIM